MTRLQKILLIALTVALTVVGVGIYQQAGKDSLPGRTVKVGQPAPDYAAKTLDGEAVRLSDFEGEKAVMVNLWATWCEPCRNEIPALQKLYEQYKEQGLVVIGVSIDGQNDEGKIRNFAESIGITYPILHDPGERFAPTFQTIGVPETILIDKDGDITYRWRGEFDPISQETRDIVENAISQKDGSIETEAKNVHFLAAFVAGFLSAFSPCFFPLIPSFVAYLAGVSLKDLEKKQVKRSASRVRRRLLTNALSFVVGFSTIFVILGFSASVLGSAFTEYSQWLARIGGAVIILFGLSLLGVLKIPLFAREWKLFQPQPSQPPGYGKSFLVGTAFGAGWTPCIGPVLAAILTLAATQSAINGVLLLSAYSLGLAIPFVLIAVFADKFLLSSKRFQKWIPLAMKINGILLIVIGLLLLTGLFKLLTQFIS